MIDMKQGNQILFSIFVAAVLSGFIGLPGRASAAVHAPRYSRSMEVSGEWLDGRAEVVWRESGYDEIAGFKVFRVDDARESALQAAWIPVDFNRSGGAAYRITDPAAIFGEAAVYRIDGLRMDGSVETLGFWSVSFEERLQDEYTPKRHLLSEKQFQVATADSVLAGPALKVPVVEPGIYGVSFEAIASGLGVPVEDVESMAQNAELSMHTGGEAVAYRVDEERILFFGWPVTNRYTLVNYFWIEPGSGVHMAEHMTEAIAVPDDLTHVGHAPFRQRLIMTPDQYTELPDDFYFWAGFSGSVTRNYNMPLPGYATNDVTVAVSVRGWNTNANHQAVVTLNEGLLGSVFFSGRDEVTGTFTTPAAADNQLKISIVQPSEGTSLFALRQFDVFYERYYEPIGSVLLADDGGHSRLSASRYTDPVVLDITHPAYPVHVTGPGGVIHADHSWTVEANSRWAFRERASIPVLEPVTGGFGGWMESATNRVDYLVISPREFAGPAENLAAYRRSLGLRTAVAVFEDICDQFAHGLKTPDAIRDMLSYAHATWDSPPLLVVLGGRGHFDYLGLLGGGTEINHLPPLLAGDSATLRPADLLFSDLTGDEIPDFSIGRIPAQTALQFSDYVAKLQAYEAGQIGLGIDRILFAADNADEGGNFTESNQSLAERAEVRYSVEATGLDTQSLSVVRSSITNALLSGYGILHYTGHGTAKQFAAEDILSSASVAGLASHDPVPLVISLTCYVGRFDDYRPIWKSLAESLITKPEGGSLAVYSPSGLSWNNYAQEMGESFYEMHASDPADALGPVLVQARRHLGPKSGLSATSSRTYNLLGDPALKLAGGAGAEPPAWITDLAQWRWERYSYAELGDLANSYEAIVAFVATNGFLSVLPAERTHGEGAVDGQSVDVVSIVHWAAETEVPWITITAGTIGENNGQVTYSVMANSGAARSGTITVSGGGIDRTFMVQQDASSAGGGWDTGFEDLGANWRWLDGFGTYIPLSGGWYWHNRHGYFSPTATSTPDRMVMYTMDMGWLYTRQDLFPYLYRYRDPCWLWYLTDSQHPRWFYNLTQGVWEQW